MFAAFMRGGLGLDVGTSSDRTWDSELRLSEGECRPSAAVGAPALGADVACCPEALTFTPACCRWAEAACFPESVCLNVEERTGTGGGAISTW